jgi:hypothetical protein
MSIEKMDATGKTADGKKHTASLEHAVKFTGWPTARATDADKSVRTRRGAMNEVARKGGPQDLDCAAQITGPGQPTSPAQTGKPASLNPAFPLWLMGYPRGWLCCGVLGTQSWHRWLKSLSKRSQKQSKR